MAKAEDVAQKDIVEAAVVAFYNAWQNGQINLEEMKTPARSLKVLWALNIPDDFSFFAE